MEKTLKDIIQECRCCINKIEDFSRNRKYGFAETEKNKLQLCIEELNGTLYIEKERVLDGIKFYEFNKEEYYALIAASTKEEAIKYYSNIVGDYEGNEPEILTKGNVLVILNKRSIPATPIHLDNYIVNNNIPCILLIDGALL